MIIFLVIIVSLLAVVLFLRGEGSSYGKGNNRSNEEKGFGVSDKSFFL